MNDLTLEERMARLEWQNRWLKLGMLALVAMVAGFVCLAATEPVAKVVRAERFEMVDATGTIRGSFGVDANGWSGVTLRDKRGKTRARLVQLADEAPALVLCDEDEQPRADLGLGNDGTPALFLRDMSAAAAVNLSVSHTGSPLLMLFDKEMKARAALMIADGKPALHLFDEQGKPRAALGTTKLDWTRFEAKDMTPESSLVLFDKDGKVLWKAP